MSIVKPAWCAMRFLRSGYPDGVPSTGYGPLLALLPRRLSDDEVATVASTLASRATAPVELTAVRVAITKVTGALPSQSDTERVARRVVASGSAVCDLPDTALS
jgi:Protein of unknown function (DUF3349)